MMKTKIILLLILGTLSQPIFASFFFEFNGHTYQVVTTPLSWSAAKSGANNSTYNGVSGYLAVIDSEAENAAIYNQLQANIGSGSFGSTTASDGGGSAYVWIGANDLSTEGTWVWDNTGTQFWSGNQSGSAVGGRYNNWGESGGTRNEPDNTNQQDAAGIALQTWPNPNLNAGFVLGTAGQWNDVDVTNTLYSVIEYDVASTPGPGEGETINSYRYANNYDVVSAVPRGCLTELPTELPIPSSQLLVEGTVNQEVNRPDDTDFENVSVRIRAWRYGCHDPNRSAIMINFALPSGASEALLDQIEMRPAIIWRDGKGDIPLTAYHWNHGPDGVLGMDTGGRGYDSAAFPNGVTYLLDTPAFGEITSGELDDFISRYNGAGQLRIVWETKTVLADLPAYNPSRDEPQKDQPVFTGRMTGQWVADGLPATGLLLQVGEVPRQDRNYLFAIWFTYLDGQPIWVASNKDIPLDTTEVTLDMAFYEGGQLFNRPGEFTGADLTGEILGTMTVRVINCNAIEVETDFSSSGLGQSTLNMSRLIRIAGYDCDGTQAVQ